MRDDGFEHVDIAVVALRREVAALARAGIDDARPICRHRERRQPRERDRAEALAPFLLGQIQPVGRQRLVDGAAAGMLHRLAPGLVIVEDLLEALAHGILGLRLDRDCRALQVVEQRVHAVLEQRQPVLHAGMAAAFADRFIQRIVTLGRAELGDIAHAESADGIGDELELGDRHEVERTHVEQRALGFGVEGTDRFQAVAEEVEAHRLLEARRKQIQNSAAHRVFAGLAHGGGTVVAVVLEPGDDGVHRHDVARRDRQRLRGDQLARRHALYHRVHRGQHDQRLVAAGERGQPRQRCQALCQDAAMWRDAVIRLAVPGRKGQHRQIGREEPKCAFERLHARAVAADDRKADGRLLRPRRDGTGEIGDDEAFGAFRHIGKRQRAAGREQLGRRFHPLLHALPSAIGNALMRANSAPATSAGSTLSPVMAA